MAKFNVATIAVMAQVQAGMDKNLIDRIIAHSKLASEASEMAKAGTDESKGSKSTLLTDLRELAVDVLSREGWGRDHFDIAIGFAVASGAAENTIKMYSSTIGSYIEATQREENPLPVEPLADTEAVKYTDLRDMLKSEADKKLAATRKEIAGYVATLTQAELDRYATELREFTQERRDSREAKKADAAARKLAKAATQPGPVVEVQAEPQQAQRAA